MVSDVDCPHLGNLADIVASFRVQLPNGYRLHVTQCDTFSLRGQADRVRVDRHRTSALPGATGRCEPSASRPEGRSYRPRRWNGDNARMRQPTLDGELFA